ncbi:MAG: hypothetical protein CMJ84_10935 [Planctomycetes bacterium]|nr:hypothetical protein [Planctomycetota bacterium]MDP6409188.1 hypothetical protein [Planctomycetota bacterium]
MTRAVLSLFLCAALLVLGLAAAGIQSRNHQQAEELDGLKRRCDLVGAGNESLEAAILAREFDLELENIARDDGGPSR